MKKITLICGLGMSTSMLQTSMEEAAKNEGIEVEIRAIAEVKFQEYEGCTDILLIGPQVAYLEKKLRAKYGNSGIKIAVIDSVDYGMMNGKKVLLNALRM
jgi:Phosphotransferase system cellobiose-specific component IIB